MSSSQPLQSGDFFQSEPRNPWLRWMGCLSVGVAGLVMLAYLPVGQAEAPSVKPTVTKTVAAQPAR